MAASTARWASVGPFDPQGVEIPSWVFRGEQDVAVYAQFPDGSLGAAAHVVLLCHGLGGSHRGYSRLGSHLASHGYAVLHPQFLDSFELVAPSLGLAHERPEAWLSDEAARQAMHVMLFDPQHWFSRIRRVHHVLDTISEQRHIPLELDPSNVIVAGHSYGAYTAQLLMGTRLFDTDLDGVVLTHDAVAGGVLMSPQGSGDRGLTSESWNGVVTPLLEVTATYDYGPHGEGLAWRREAFDRSRSRYRHLAIVKGGNHLLGGVSAIGSEVGTSVEPEVSAIAGLAAAFSDRVHGDLAAGRWLEAGPYPAIFQHEHKENS